MIATITLLIALAAAEPPVQVMAPPPIAGSAHDAPHWIKRPSGDDFDRNYPYGARHSGTQGHAVIRCQVDVQGKMENCEIVSETPPNAGFGAATLKLAPYFQMSTTSTSGRSTAGAKVEIPVSWKLH